MAVPHADAQALTRKLSEAALGLSSGKELHKFLPPDSLLPSPLKADAAALEASSLSGGRNGIHRPQVNPFLQSEIILKAIPS